MRHKILLLGIPTALLAACAAQPTIRTAKVVAARVNDTGADSDRLGPASVMRFRM